MNRLILLLLLAAVASSHGQTTAGDQSDVEPRYLVDIPTAGLLKRGAFALDVDFFQEGGVALGLSAGALDRLSFGVFYGGSEVIGSGKARMQKLPGVILKFRLFDESTVLPAVAVGFDSQGKEAYIDSTERFTIKSRGFFATASKNYSFLGNLSLHGGVNLSMERSDGDKDMDVFVGAEKSLGAEISLLFEYDFGFNDNAQNSIGKGKGYMNAGARWSMGNGFTLGFDLKNLVKNQENITIGNRVIRIEYVRTL